MAKINGPKMLSGKNTHPYTFHFAGFGSWSSVVWILQWFSVPPSYCTCFRFQKIAGTLKINIFFKFATMTLCEKRKF